jgi:hypothetical protein
MPDAGGNIKGIASPGAPWLQAFSAGDKVRVARGIDNFGEIPGTVVRTPESTDEWVLVELDRLELNNRGLWSSEYTQSIFRPGELRRLS